MTPAAADNKNMEKGAACTMNQTSQTMIFCDFDRSITTEETFVGSLMRLCSQESLEDCFGRFKRGEIPLRLCIETLFSRVKSSRYPIVEEYAKTIQIREGFSEFLDTAKELGIPVVVISGGIRAMQEKLLAPYMDRIEALYSCDLDLSGEYMNFACKYGSETENVSKDRIIDSYAPQKAICIGDSLTDFGMAERCEVVFARDDLIAYMEKSGRPFFRWETFHDISAELRRMEKAAP